MGLWAPFGTGRRLTSRQVAVGIGVLAILLAVILVAGDRSVPTLPDRSVRLYSETPAVLDIRFEMSARDPDKAWFSVDVDPLDNAPDPVRIYLDVSRLGLAYLPVRPQSTEQYRIGDSPLIAVDNPEVRLVDTNSQSTWLSLDVTPGTGFSLFLEFSEPLRAAGAGRIVVNPPAFIAYSTGQGRYDVNGTQTLLAVPRLSTIRVWAGDSAPAFARIEVVRPPFDDTAETATWLVRDAEYFDPFAVLVIPGEETTREVRLLVAGAMLGLGGAVLTTAAIGSGSARTVEREGMRPAPERVGGGGLRNWTSLLLLLLLSVLARRPRD